MSALFAQPICSTYVYTFGSQQSGLINPLCACTARVTVVCLSVCLCVCLSVCLCVDTYSCTTGYEAAY